MLCVVTSIRDPVALAATCLELSLTIPKERTFQLHQKEASGWVVRLPGLRRPVMFDLRTGLVAYHRLDNAYERYAHLMRFIHTFYAVQTRLKRASVHVLCKDNRSVPVKEAI
jgi:hypothetical protein